MPVFEYKGLNSSGKNVRGNIDADNQKLARAKLKKDGVFVTEIRDKTKATSAKTQSGRTSGARVNIQEKSNLTRQLATLLKAGIPLVDSLTAVADQIENPDLKAIVADVKNQVNEGTTLHKALSRHPKVFDHIYITMCEAGEATGTLDVILLRLAEFTEAQHALVTKVRSAVLYPVIMTIFLTLMLSVMFVFVIPRMTAIFESSEMQLPWYTNVTIAVSGFFVDYWIVVLAMGALGYISFRSWKATPAGSRQWDVLTLQFPLIGRLARMIAVSRFTRTLSTLLTGGVAMLQAMDIVRNVVGNQVLAEAIDQARENIREGESIAGPLKKSGQFPPIVIHMVNIGEKTGDLEAMLTQVANSFDYQVDTEIQGLTSALGPLLIVVMGLVIGGVVFSIMVPIFQMSQLGAT
ncbi:MAG TPA: type II secretion system inner membrane protein GspF [Pseudobdellovibrionaceae bacterium]|nr:type II secretion system inner membrane protein GspF [Pseudobdellovibrionaceae bacterium]